MHQSTRALAHIVAARPDGYGKQHDIRGGEPGDAERAQQAPALRIMIAFHRSGVERRRSIPQLMKRYS